MNVHGKSALTRAQRAGQVARVLWVTLFLNWTVAAFKLVFGLATHCMVIVADGLHSFSDGASNIIGLIAVTISAHPADYDHPYGHQKYETLAAVCISFFLFIVSFGIFREAVAGLVHPKTPEVNLASFLVMGTTLLVNFFVVWYERRRGRELKSDLLLSDSWHTMSDIFVTLSVLVALVGISFNIPRLDAVFSLVIASVIVVTAVNVLKRSSDVLVDKSVLETGKIESIVRSVEGIRDCHEIRTRGRIDDAYVDLHVLVDPQMTVLESHRLANIIEHNIRAQIPGVHDVVVHVEPTTHEHDEV